MIKYLLKTNILRSENLLHSFLFTRLSSVYEKKCFNQDLGSNDF